MNEQNKEENHEMCSASRCIGSLALAPHGRRGRNRASVQQRVRVHRQTRKSQSLSNGLRDSGLLPADNLSPPTAIKGPFVFEADMHPENESTTLNKCNPQKV